MGCDDLLVCHDHTLGADVAQRCFDPPAKIVLLDVWNNIFKYHLPPNRCSGVIIEIALIFTKVCRADRHTYGRRDTPSLRDIKCVLTSLRILIRIAFQMSSTISPTFNSLLILLLISVVIVMMPYGDVAECG